MRAASANAAITMRCERVIRGVIRILNYRLFDYLLFGYRFLDRRPGRFFRQSPASDFRLIGAVL
jgi:hypothetical protein